VGTDAAAAITRTPASSLLFKLDSIVVSPYHLWLVSLLVTPS
jgi:hypothetical protein